MDKQNVNEGNPEVDLLIEHMAHGFAYCQMQFENGHPCDFTYLMVNPAFVKFTGLSNVVGKKVTEVIPGIRQSNPELFETYGRVSLTGRSENFESYVPGIRIWFSVTVYSPKKYYFVATFENITERKNGEISLRKSQEEAIQAGLLKDQALIELNAINNNALIGIAISNIIPATNRTLLRVNPHFEEILFGYDKGELVGKLVRILYASKEDFDVVARTHIPQLTSTRGPCIYEAKFIRKDETVFLGRGTVTLVDPLNEAKGVITLLQDITEERRTKDKLHASLHDLGEKELAKTRFLAAAGHDLRQPLTAANLYIDALKITITEPTAVQSKIIQRLDQTMSNFNGLLDALLNVSKLDAGVIKPEIVSINVAELFIWLEQSFAPFASEKHIQFKLYFPLKKPLVVCGDTWLLNSVLMNLISNAINFTSRGGILVSARQRENYVLFQVWDTGIGILDEDIDRIFDDFFQLDNQQRDRTRGLGLGLSIAKRAISLLDGKIACRSRIGYGSVFEFRLPMGGIASNAIQEENTVKTLGLEIIGSFAQGKRFVVVEDDGLVAEALCQSLGMIGGAVECFDNARNALEHPNIATADCYIVDYMLSGSLSGIEFLNILHEKQGKSLIAVLITGDTSKDLMSKVGMFNWPVLHKPVNLSELISKLSNQYS